MDKAVLEIGAGTGLLSIVASLLGKSKSKPISLTKSKVGLMSYILGPAKAMNIYLNVSKPSYFAL